MKILLMLKVYVLFTKHGIMRGRPHPWELMVHKSSTVSEMFHIHKTLFFLKCKMNAVFLHQEVMTDIGTAQKKYTIVT